MVIGKCFCVILFYIVSVLQCFGNRVIDTNVGSFSGAAATDGDYFEFLGIPYGQVNTSNPFGVATPHPAIDGIFEADDDSAKCPQVESGTTVGNLDCLRLNIFVPNTANATSLVPVMVFIHGGFFQRGYASKTLFGPRFLIRHDVIIVTITYRIGPYGFMCLNQRAVPGNQGLKDQVLALKWVKDNIEAFGGNPNQVTLFGQSAGAHSIDLHLLSEHDKLYNNIILQSGSSVALTVLFEPDREAPIKMASYLSLNHESLSEALNSLTNASPADVIRAASSLGIEFKPCAETEFDDVEPFITDYWINSPVPKARDLSIMIGFTEYECMTWHLGKNDDHFQSISNLFYSNLNQTFNLDANRMNRMEGYSRRFYLGDDVINEDAVWQIINYETDYVYGHPIQRSIKKFTESGANVFYYMFSYSGERNAASYVQRASHADDIRYLFDMPGAPMQINAHDQIAIDRMTTMWTNFAKYSNPTPTNSSLLPVQWIPLTSSIYHYLKIDSDLTMERRPFRKRMAFWDLFYELNDEYQREFEAATNLEDGGNGGVVRLSNLLTVLVTLLLIVIYR